MALGAARAQAVVPLSHAQAARKAAAGMTRARGPRSTAEGEGALAAWYGKNAAALYETPGAQREAQRGAQDHPPPPGCSAPCDGAASCRGNQSQSQSRHTQRQSQPTAGTPAAYLLTAASTDHLR